MARKWCLNPALKPDAFFPNVAAPLAPPSEGSGARNAEEAPQAQAQRGIGSVWHISSGFMSCVNSLL